MVEIPVNRVHAPWKIEGESSGVLLSSSARARYRSLASSSRNREGVTLYAGKDLCRRLRYNKVFIVGFTFANSEIAVQILLFLETRRYEDLPRSRI